MLGWVYDIYLDDAYVASQGECTFDTKEKAIDDANQYIENILGEYYKVKDLDKFEVQYYQVWLG